MRKLGQLVALWLVGLWAIGASGAHGPVSLSITLGLFLASYWILAR